jgi:hypothetical protein
MCEEACDLSSQQCAAGQIRNVRLEARGDCEERRLWASYGCARAARASVEMSMTNRRESLKCWTCYVTTGDHGPRNCPDCGGLGQLPSPLVLTEWRLRELERSYSGGGQAGQDVGWLISEVRKAHHALVQILAAGQEADDGDAIATRIRFLANEVLQVYPTTPEA